ncbi:MAG: hypothetical protein FWF09_06175 [Bacteroidales bacterium]|nr:hypothetical protein [Bacteroidales bacterium]
MHRVAPAPPFPSMPVYSNITPKLAGRSWLGKKLFGNVCGGAMDVS